MQDRVVSLRRGGFALARMSVDYRQHMNRLPKNDPGDVKSCEICGLAGQFEDSPELDAWYLNGGRAIR